MNYLNVELGDEDTDSSTMLTKNLGKDQSFHRDEVMVIMHKFIEIAGYSFPKEETYTEVSFDDPSDSLVTTDGKAWKRKKKDKQY